MQNMDLFDDPPGHSKDVDDGKGMERPPSDSLRRAKVEALDGELRDNKIEGFTSKEKSDPAGFAPSKRGITLILGFAK